MGIRQRAGTCALLIALFLLVVSGSFVATATASSEVAGNVGENERSLLEGGDIVAQITRLLQKNNEALLGEVRHMIDEALLHYHDQHHHDQQPAERPPRRLADGGAAITCESDTGAQQQQATATLLLATERGEIALGTNADVNLYAAAAPASGGGGGGARMLKTDSAFSASELLSTGDVKASGTIDAAGGFSVNGAALGSGPDLTASPLALGANGFMKLWTGLGAGSTLISNETPRRKVRFSIDRSVCAFKGFVAEIYVANNRDNDHTWDGHAFPMHYSKILVTFGGGTAAAGPNGGPGGAAFGRVHILTSKGTGYLNNDIDHCFVAEPTARDHSTIDDGSRVHVLDAATMAVDIKFSTQCGTGIGRDGGTVGWKPNYDVVTFDNTGLVKDVTVIN